MTASEWQTSTDPVLMLRFLRGRMSPRKLRLFAVAVARVLEDRLPADLRSAVDVGERLADGLASEAEQLDLLHRFHALSRRERSRGIIIPPEEMDAHYAARRAVEVYPAGPEGAELSGWEGAAPVLDRSVAARLPHLLRDVFGNPFRSVTFDPAWLTPTVSALARGMYESRDFAAMPILADALQDAGCEDADMLDHCRDPSGVHVRGCWVVELVLGKG